MLFSNNNTNENAFVVYCVSSSKCYGYAMYSALELMLFMWNALLHKQLAAQKIFGLFENNFLIYQHY